MATQVTMYADAKGRLFETEQDADTSDAADLAAQQLEQLVSDCWTLGTYDTEEVTSMLIQNANKFAPLLAKLANINLVKEGR